MPIKKTNLFSNQASTSRIDSIKKVEFNKVNLSYPKGYLVKNETELNSRATALLRVRSGGYVVKNKFHEVVTNIPTDASSASVVTKPVAPTIGIVTILDSSSLIVSFTAPSGTGTITNYTVTSSLGDIRTGSSSPITVSGLVSNTAYTFTVTATNSSGTSVASSASTSVNTYPDAPIIEGTQVLSDSEISIYFIEQNGGTGTVLYTAVSDPEGKVGSSLTSPVTVSGLTPNTEYTFIVTATN